MKNKLSNIFIALVFIFMFMPILILVIFSFNSSNTNILFSSFSLKWYLNLFENKELIEAFKNTLIVTITSTFFATLIGTICSLALNKYNFKGKNLMNKLTYIPIVMPDIVMGISLLSIYTLLKVDLSLTTLIISHVAFCIPYVIVSVKSCMNKELSSCEEAARDLGASELEVFRKITIPYIIPGISSGMLLCATLSLDDVVVSFFTAGPGANTLPLYIYSVIKTGVTPDVNVLSTFILLITLSVLILLNIKEARKVKARYEKM